MEDKLPADFKADSYSIKPYRITKYVKNRDIIDLGERKIEVLFTPGHSLDSLCLLDSKNRGLFVGDTFYLSSLYAHLPGSNFSDYYATSALLDSMADEIKILFPCHRKTSISSLYLKKMHEAFKEIKSTIGSTINSDQEKEIQFDGFSVIV
jgi:glyoxylase-like metal-dependent hydrolase (beta-lactamase superfamily II)